MARRSAKKRKPTPWTSPRISALKRLGSAFGDGDDGDALGGISDGFERVADDGQIGLGQLPGRLFGGGGDDQPLPVQVPAGGRGLPQVPGAIRQVQAQEDLQLLPDLPSLHCDPSYTSAPSPTRVLPSHAGEPATPNIKR